MRVHRGALAGLITDVVLSNASLARAQDANGKVTDAKMAQSIGDAMLDKVTTNTFRRWRFKLGTVSQVRVPIDYE
jgi:hypothetical protein